VLFLSLYLSDPPPFYYESNRMRLDFEIKD